MYLLSYKYAGMSVRGWECLIYNQAIKQPESNKVSFISEQDYLQWKLNFVVQTATLEDLYIQHMDESALFVLPLTLEQYVAQYPGRLNKQLLKTEKLRTITVAELVCTPYEQLFVLPGLGAKTIADIAAIMFNAHGLRLGLNLPYQGLTSLCVRYIPLLQNAYKSHYDSYKSVTGSVGDRGADKDNSAYAAAAATD